MAIVEGLGDVGTRYSLFMVNGTAYGPYRMSIALPDSTPVNLTGATLDARVWHPSDPYTALESLATDVVSAVGGTFDLSLDPTKLGKLAALNKGMRNLSLTDLAPLAALALPQRDPVALEWALYLTPPSGLGGRRVFYGPVLIYIGAKP